MVQGGGLDENMQPKKTKFAIKNEATNGLSNKRGTLAMARTPDPHSASSQFFINLVDNNRLDFKSENPREFGYCVFGWVTSGMDVVEKIEKVATGNVGYFDDVPKEPVVILQVEAL